MVIFVKTEKTNKLPLYCIVHANWTKFSLS